MVLHKIKINPMRGQKPPPRPPEEQRIAQYREHSFSEQTRKKTWQVGWIDKKKGISPPWEPWEIPPPRPPIPSLPRYAVDQPPPPKDTITIYPGGMICAFRKQKISPPPVPRPPPPGEVRGQTKTGGEGGLKRTLTLKNTSLMPRTYRPGKLSVSSRVTSRSKQPRNRMGHRVKMML